jgi:hypothetical protein
MAHPLRWLSGCSLADVASVGGYLDLEAATYRALQG